MYKPVCNNFCTRTRISSFPSEFWSSWWAEAWIHKSSKTMTTKANVFLIALCPVSHLPCSSLLFESLCKLRVSVFWPQRCTNKWQKIQSHFARQLPMWSLAMYTRGFLKFVYLNFSGYIWAPATVKITDDVWTAAPCTTQEDLCMELWTVFGTSKIVKFPQAKSCQGTSRKFPEAWIRRQNYELFPQILRGADPDHCFKHLQGDLAWSYSREFARACVCVCVCEEIHVRERERDVVVNDAWFIRKKVQLQANAKFVHFLSCG